jgi:hypothetical protein
MLYLLGITSLAIVSILSITKLYVTEPLKTNFLFLIYFTTISFVLFLIQDTDLKFFIKSKNKKEVKSSFGLKFMLSYLFALIPYTFVMGFKLSGHNYHQIVIVPLFTFLIAYFVIVFANLITNTAKQFVKIPNLDIFVKVIMIVLFIAILYPKSVESRDRMFNTQFPGIDIAGDYINLKAAPNERFFHSSGNSFGSLWNAQRKGYKRPGNIGILKNATTNDINVKWILAYGPAGGFAHYCLFNVQCSEDEQLKGQYLRENFRMVQFGFVPQGESVQPMWVLFKMGGNFSENLLSEYLGGLQPQIKEYEYTHSKYQIGYFNLE